MDAARRRFRRRFASSGVPGGDGAANPSGPEVARVAEQRPWRRARGVPWVREATEDPILRERIIGMGAMMAGSGRVQFAGRVAA